MAKKSKRQTSKGTTRTTPAPVVQSTPKSTEFNPDYSPVIKDLRRIGLLASTFLAVLIVLSFFIN